MSTSGVAGMTLRFTLSLMLTSLGNFQSMVGALSMTRKTF